MTWKKICLTISLVLSVVLTASAAKWTWKWPKQKAPVKAEITPVKYGKEWAYTLELDDSLKCGRTVAEKMLSQHQFTDAPAGIKGGKPITFKGSVAAFIITLEGKNSRNFNWDDLEYLRDKGWAVVNHGYWSTGNHWDPKGRLTPEQFKRELFWGQTFLANKLWDNKYVPSHLVYPNGDHYYGPHMDEFGLHYATTTGGKRYKLTDKKINLKRVGRRNLDWHGWKKKGAKVLHDFPKESNIANELVIDFTHSIKDDTSSEHYQTWQKRLNKISELYGKDGKDNVWSATTTDILDYYVARKNAKLAIKKNKLTLTLPDDAPPAALTIKLTGIKANTKLKAPKGGCLYRQGDTVWVTTSVLGKKGKVPTPKINLAYEGKASNKIVLDTPVKFACIRMLQLGKLPDGYKPDITLVAPDGKETKLNVDKIMKWVPIKYRWGCWLMFPTLPEEKAPLVKEVRFNNDKAFKKVEIWSVD